ncbi:nucleoside 2-deoxyribosyltransferase [Pseudomonas sp. GM48]|uniref:nucleoside 2-deoxyribosyltransferase n=1 Tax=Pseudomonas sp. GM48 TaxID=1144330 RepID=UPI00027049BB|nr:nucleoside 2-deoxyribosyltransferase [Pseudomonas sp. GM48]EJM61298.1 nucleoside 2-deoxyribosyltransferase [Pseudomonas sp. GM48]
MTSKKRVYLAAPLFNEMELSYNKSLANKLSQYFDVFLPQEDGLLLRDLIRSGLAYEKAERMVFDADIQAMQESDILIAILNGGHIDEGVAFELGFSYATGKRCIGFKTDIRQALPSGNNPMINQSCEKIFDSEDTLFKWIIKHYNPAPTRPIK